MPSTGLSRENTKSNVNPSWNVKSLIPSDVSPSLSSGIEDDSASLMQQKLEKQVGSFCCLLLFISLKKVMSTMWCRSLLLSLLTLRWLFYRLRANMGRMSSSSDFAEYWWMNRRRRPCVLLVLSPRGAGCWQEQLQHHAAACSLLISVFTCTVTWNFNAHTASSTLSRSLLSLVTKIQSASRNTCEGKQDKTQIRKKNKRPL